MIAAFEARQISLTNTQATIAKAEAAGADGSLFQCAVLLLADFALDDSLARNPLRVSPTTALRHLNRDDKGMTPRLEFALLHWGENREKEGREIKRHGPGKPPYGYVLIILSGLAWHLNQRTKRRHYEWLAELVLGIYPPIFLRGAIERDWRKLSDTIRKSMKKRGQRGHEDYQALASTCQRLKPVEHR